MTEIAGRIGDGLHVLTVRVYYEDTDFSGAVYHANYLKFCERGRSDFLRLLGIHHTEIGSPEQGGLGFVVRHMDCDFVRRAVIDDLLNVETRFVEYAGARMILRQQVKREAELLFDATVTVALVDRNGRPRRFPEKMRAAFATFATSQS
ncbi:MAG: tol-pal system-associated acyl-CoA thioesterase [Parvibaculaceae bacterium]